MQIDWIKALLKAVLPEAVRRWIRTQQRQLGRLKHHPRLLLIRFGSLRRLRPIRSAFGWGYGQCIDRYYIEAFLNKYASDIHGHVLEIADNIYTHRFGGDNVIQSDVLHVTQGNPNATIIADLSSADHIPSETFDCIIFTQTLQFIYDVRTAIRTLYRILQPSGVLLVTIPGISQIARFDMERWGEYWRFTTLSVRKLFIEVFPDYCITVQAYGNVLTAIAFLHGLISNELRQGELDYHDPDYEVLITVRAVKPEKQRHGEHNA